MDTLSEKERATLHKGKEVAKYLLDTYTSFAPTQLLDRVAYYMPKEFTPDTPYASTDGDYMYLGEKFADVNMSDGQFIQLHEVLHRVLMHPARGIGKDMEIYNIAGDYIVNSILIETFGLTPLKGIYYDPKYSAKIVTTEEVYNELLAEKRQGKQPSKPKNPVFDKDLKEGSFSENPVMKQESEDFVRAMASAEKAEAGSGRGEIDRLLSSMGAGVAHWKEELEQYFTKAVQSYYSYNRLNKRYLYADIIMPKRIKHKSGLTGVIAVDTSGSVSEKLLLEFMGEIENLFNSVDMEGNVLLFTDGVYRDIAVPPFPTEYSVNAGGTNFKSVFTYMEANNMNPDVLLFFTDMGDTIPPEEPPYPVIWVTKASLVVPVPYGDIVTLPDA